MRFCMVTTFYPPYHFGGDGTYVRALARALVARGHAVEVVHCVDAFRLKSRAMPQPSTTADGVVVHTLQSRWGPLSPLFTQQTGRPLLKTAALQEIFDRDFDVVNFHNISLIGGSGVLAMSRSPVNLYTLHEHWLICPTHVLWKNRRYACDRARCFSCCLRSGIPPQLWRYGRALRRGLTNIDLLISPSHYTARRHRAAGVERPIHVLPLFSTIKGGPSTRRALAHSSRFLYVGRLTASKGIVPLVEYFTSVPQYELCVVGDGELRRALEDRCVGRSNIRLLGAIAQTELAELYQSATALIVPSLAPETFGLAVVEALASGTPAVVRDAGGLRELIDRSGAGFVYHTDTELRNAVDSLAQDPQLRLELGKRAHAAYERYYSEARHIDAYLECVDGIQKKKGLVDQCAQ